MKSDSKEIRRNQIMDIATEVLNEHGYRNASMLKVAKAASASKETLYAWFGDKRGLFEAIIHRNARDVQQVLEDSLNSSAPMEQALYEFGQALLQLLMSENAIALNRAAISEVRTDPELAQALLSAGRNATLPLFINLLEYHQQQGQLDYESAPLAASDFLGLLIGDATIRRLLGGLEQPSQDEIAQRALHATNRFMRLYKTG